MSTTPIKISQFDFLKRNKDFDYAESHTTEVVIYEEGVTKCGGCLKYLVQKQPNRFGISIFKKEKEIEFISGVIATKTYEGSLSFFNSL